ncbi:recombinase family protein [Neptuniibacter sp. QD29_5]|uniref:recombinase family protein n=1 Tax=Neptuniibacter sp. QD29_5 TaxID=3398207 RepID=UPI0039F584BA
MAVVGWARVSSEAQCLEGQLELLNEHNCDRVFASKHSGKAKGKNIDKLNEMISYVRDGDIVVCTKLDRLGRSLKEVLQTVDALKEKNVYLKVLQQPIDTSNNDAFSNAMLQLMGVFAEMERCFIKERTQAGKERTGNYGGRKKLISTEDRNKIKEQVKLGATQYKLAKQYGVTATTIHRIINE